MKKQKNVFWTNEEVEQHLDNDDDIDWTSLFYFGNETMRYFGVQGCCYIHIYSIKFVTVYGRYMFNNQATWFMATKEFTLHLGRNVRKFHFTKANQQKHTWQWMLWLQLHWWADWCGWMLPCHVRSVFALSHFVENAFWWLALSLCYSNNRFCPCFAFCQA